VLKGKIKSVLHCGLKSKVGVGVSEGFRDEKKCQGKYTKISYCHMLESFGFYGLVVSEFRLQ
jgi:hypothetical protein